MGSVHLRPVFGLFSNRRRVEPSAYALHTRGVLHVAGLRSRAADGRFATLIFTKIARLAEEFPSAAVSLIGAVRHLSDRDHLCSAAGRLRNFKLIPCTL